ncbi:MAG TPA: hypothetical protein VF723_09010 [Pyrinomonadaceae bacterium]
MKIKGLTTLGSMALAALLLVAGTQTNALAQGRGGGRGGGGGISGGGAGRGGGPSGAPGVDRGLGTAGSSSRGRSDEGLGNASGRSGGRSDDGLERARAARNNRENRDNESRRHGDAPRTDKDLNRFQGIAHKLNTTPEALRSQYEAALAANPDLKFGQFVAANVIADNLGATHANITSAAILSGLQSGRSIGRTLQDLGLSSSEAKAAQRNAERQIKERKR